MVYFRKWLPVVFLFISIILFTAYNISPIVHKKVEQTSASIEKLLQENPNYNSSIGVRAGFYKYGYESVKDNILFGVGTGDSIDEIRKHSPKNWVGRKQPHEHNQFLSTFIKLGLVGLLIFLNIFYQIFKYKQEDKELRFIMIFSTLAIAFGILTTQFNLRFFMPLWVVMLSITLIDKNRRTIKKEIDDKKVLLQIIAAGAIFSIFNFISKLS
jgi:O-antigen ligase